MSFLIGVLLVQVTPSPVVQDPYAADPYRSELVYRSEMKRIRALLEGPETWDEGYLAVHDLLEKHPGSPLLHYEKGCYFAREKKWDLASEQWNEAVFADNGKTVVTLRALEGVAGAQWSRGNKGEAIKALEKIAHAAPLSFTVHNRLARAYRAVGQSGKAREAWARSYALNPAQPEIRKRLGMKPARARPVVLLPTLIKRIRSSIVLLKSKNSRFTGFVGLKKGWIITCAHGMEADTREVEVISFGAKQTSHTAGVVFRDENRDLALIHCPTLPSKIPVLSIHSAADLEVGERVYTLGNPGLGKDILTLTPAEGILANAKRELDGCIFLQSSMSVNPGNSGGPLLNRYGEVIGVVVRKAWIEGVSFSVPVSELAEALASPGSLHAPPLEKAKSFEE